MRGTGVRGIFQNPSRSVRLRDSMSIAFDPFGSTARPGSLPRPGLLFSSLARTLSALALLTQALDAFDLLCQEEVDPLGARSRAQDAAFHPTANGDRRHAEPL